MARIKITIKGPEAVSFTQHQNGAGFTIKKVPDYKRPKASLGFNFGKFMRPIATLAVLAMVGMLFPPKDLVRAAVSVELKQCANGTIASPDNPCDWVNGNVNV